MNKEQPTENDIVVLSIHLPLRGELESIDLRTVQPKLTKSERSMLRLFGYATFVEVQFRKLAWVGIRSRLVFDNTRRNFGFVGNMIKNNTRVHDFAIMDTGTVYEVVMIDGNQTYLTFERFNEAIDHILLTYWRLGLINEIPVWEYQDTNPEPEPCIPVPDIPRRPLTPLEDVIRKEWQNGIVNFSNDTGQCVPLPSDEVFEPEIEEGCKKLRNAGLMVGAIYENEVLAAYIGGTEIEVHENDEDPAEDLASYNHFFCIENHDKQWVIVALDDKSIKASPINFSDVVDTIIDHYINLGLIPKSES